MVDVDLRYVNYADAALLGQAVHNGGLGWRSCFVVAVGGQYAATERLTVRGGYLYNTNPIPSTLTLFNVQLPRHRHQYAVAGRMVPSFTENVVLSGGLGARVPQLGPG